MRSTNSVNRFSVLLAICSAGCAHNAAKTASKDLVCVRGRMGVNAETLTSQGRVRVVDTHKPRDDSALQIDVKNGEFELCSREGLYTLLGRDDHARSGAVDVDLSKETTEVVLLLEQPQINEERFAHCVGFIEPRPERHCAQSTVADCSIRGHVIDAGGGAAHARVQYLLYDLCPATDDLPKLEPALNLIADANGNFSLSHVTCGRALLLAESGANCGATLFSPQPGIDATTINLAR